MFPYGIEFSAGTVCELIAVSVVAFTWFFMMAPSR